MYEMVRMPARVRSRARRGNVIQFPGGAGNDNSSLVDAASAAIAGFAEAANAYKQLLDEFEEQRRTIDEARRAYLQAMDLASEAIDRVAEVDDPVEADLWSRWFDIKAMVSA